MNCHDNQSYGCDLPKKASLEEWTDSGNRSKESVAHMETSSHLKRCRRLEYDDVPAGDTPSAFLKSNENMDLLSEWNSSYLANGCASNFDDMDLSTDEWITESLSNNEMHFSKADMTYSDPNYIEIDLSEFCDFSPEAQVNEIQQQHVELTPRKFIFKGKKPMVRTPSKLSTSVAYPFAFIKPCGIQGDTTLKDINQLIHSPTPKVAQKNENLLVYPTSAFSGKPVVGKAKIHTDGGRGSITIMRTKG